MKKLVGFVLTKEQNVGVPRLVVEVYDARDTTPGEFDSDQLLGKLGRRLGSVLTRSGGRFEFSADDLEFQGNEARPNLVVAVLAPEDVRSLEKPMPLPPERRLLFLSATPRLDAGADEAYVIRLLAEQLNRFGIATETAAGSRDRDARAGDAIESSWTTSSYFTDRFKSKIRERLATATEGRIRAKKAVARLSAIPLHLRDAADGTANTLQNNHLMISDRSQLADQLSALQENAIKEGLNRLDKNGRPPVMRVYLDEGQFAALGLTIDKDGVVSGNVDGEALRTVTRNAMSGTDLVRRRGLDSPSINELRRRYLSPVAAAIAKASVPAPEVGVASKTKQRKTARGRNA